MLAPTPTTVEASALSNGRRGLHFICSMLISLIFVADVNRDDSFVLLVVIAGRTDEDMGDVEMKFRPGISASIIAELTDCNAALSQQRKKRQVFLRYIIG